MLSGPAANPVLIGSHHARAELVQNAEGGLISRQPKLPLKLHRRHALRLAGNQAKAYVLKGQDFSGDIQAQWRYAGSGGYRAARGAD